LTSASRAPRRLCRWPQRAWWSARPGSCLLSRPWAGISGRRATCSASARCLRSPPRARDPSAKGRVPSWPTGSSTASRIWISCPPNCALWSGIAWPRSRPIGPPPTNCWPRWRPCNPRPAGCLTRPWEHWPSTSRRTRFRRPPLFARLLRRKGPNPGVPLPGAPGSGRPGRPAGTRCRGVAGGGRSW